MTISAAFCAAARASGRNRKSQGQQNGEYDEANTKKSLWNQVQKSKKERISPADTEDSSQTAQSQDRKAQIAFKLKLPVIPPFPVKKTLQNVTGDQGEKSGEDCAAQKKKKRTVFQLR